MEKARPRRRWLWVPALLMGLLLLHLLLNASFRACIFAGNSMAPTIRDGDMVFFQAWGFTPRQGDIVLLEKPGWPPPPTDSAPIVKRIIATGGQHVKVDYAANAVYVDGAALEEPYILEPMADRHIPGMNLLDVTVPDGSVYVLGDNRNNSTDSRHEALGCVPAEYILGRAVYIYSP